MAVNSFYTGHNNVIKRGEDMNQSTELNKEINRFFLLWRHCNAMYENWSKQFGLSCNELIILNFILNNDKCTQKQISEFLLISKQTVNMILKRFEKIDYVNMESCPKDKRCKFIHMTQTGKELAENISEELMKVEISAFNEMGIESVRSMNECQEMFIQLFEKYKTIFHPDNADD